MSEAVLKAPTAWRPPPFIKSRTLRYGLLLGSLVYLVLAVSSLEINWERMILGLDRGWAFVVSFLHPDFGSRWDEILMGMRESLTMTLAATVAGIAISIPIGLGAAKNISNPFFYYICRGIVAVSRSLQEVIVAIFFVAMFGFGPFAGFLTLSFATIGFLAKLLAEAIEDIDFIQVEAMKSTGAGWLQSINFGVQPQVMPRLIGLCLYRLDINFRESAVVGIVGAGGIGATLNTSIQRYEFDIAAAIILMVIGIVLALEYLSGWVRKKVQ